MASAHFVQFGVTADQFVVLTLLADENGVTQRDLVEQAISDANTIDEMLRRRERSSSSAASVIPRTGVPAVFF